MKNLIAIVAILFSTQFNTLAQTFGVNMSVFQPTGEFNKNLSQNPIGLNLNYTHSIGQSKKLNVGAEAGIAMYYYSDYTIQDSQCEDIEIYEEDCFWNAHAIAQYSVYRTPMIDLYAEGRAGVTTFFSSKTIETPDTELEDEFDFHGTAFNTGLGGGVKLNVHGLLTQDATTNNMIWLDFSVTANSGTKSEYRDASEVSQLSTASANYESLTNYVQYRIGLNMRLAELFE